MSHRGITPEVQTPSWFPTEVRTALDVCGRAQFLDGPNPFPLLFEDHVGPFGPVAALPMPTSDERSQAEATLDSFVHEFLVTRLDERLDRELAVDLYGALRAVGTWTLKPRISVCVGDLARKVNIDGRRERWVFLKGEDGCGLVFCGRSSNCPTCSKNRTRRHAAQLAGWRQNHRGTLEYPVWFADGTTGVVTIGLCGVCRAEFQTRDPRQTRCDDCRRLHRGPPPGHQGIDPDVPLEAR